jgi:RimJ/RimL family protein N-acetyltransferase
MRTCPKDLKTERLLLRSFRDDDIDALLPLIGDRDIAATTLRIPHPYARKDAEQFFEFARTKVAEGHAVFAIEFEGKLSGTLGLHATLEHRKAELGYWVGKPFWGQGIVTEAAAEAIRWGFEEHGLNRIYAGCFSENPASIRVLEKLGFKFEGVSRQHLLKWGQFKDVHQYAMLARDYQDGKLNKLV